MHWFRKRVFLIILSHFLNWNNQVTFFSAVSEPKTALCLIFNTTISTIKTEPRSNSCEDMLLLLYQNYDLDWLFYMAPNPSTCHNTERTFILYILAANCPKFLIQATKIWCLVSFGYLKCSPKCLPVCAFRVVLLGQDVNDCGLKCTGYYKM